MVRKQYAIVPDPRPFTLMIERLAHELITCRKCGQYYDPRTETYDDHAEHCSGS